MLTQRTNILLDKNDYQLLTTLAQEQEVSLGSLIRTAIAKTYKKTSESKIQARKKNALAILAVWEKISFKQINYKALIEHGRKY